MANLPTFTDKDFRNEWVLYPYLITFPSRGHEVDFNLKRLYDMPNIEVSRFNYTDLSTSKWSFSMWTLINAEKRSSDMRRRDLPHRWIRDIQRSPNQRLWICCGATRRTWHSSQYALTHSMMLASACLRWRGKCECVSQSWICLKSASTTQNLLLSSRPLPLLSRETQRTTSPL